MYFCFQSQWRTISFPQYQSLRHTWFSFILQQLKNGSGRKKLIRGLVTEFGFIRENPFTALTRTAVGLWGWLDFAFATCGLLYKVLKIKVQAVLAASYCLLLKLTSGQQIAVCPGRNRSWEAEQIPGWSSAEILARSARGYCSIFFSYPQPCSGWNF